MNGRFPNRINEINNEKKEEMSYHMMVEIESFNVPYFFNMFISANTSRTYKDYK